MAVTNRRRPHLTAQDAGAPSASAPRRPHRGYGSAKRFLDVSIAFLVLVLLAPVMIAIAVAIRLESRGPILFRQRRVGLGEQSFTVLKFRSMRIDAEGQAEALRHLDITGGPTFKAVNDPRLTRLGKSLRRLSLDELPQLINVMRGDMSLVGPRPMLEQEVAQLTPRFRERFAVKPGLTCIWQVSGRSTIGFERWMELDLQYVQRRSLQLDLLLLAQTPLAVLSSRGAY